VSPIGTGVGWINLEATRNPRSVALALAPGPSSFVARPALLEAFGLDVSAADQATSVAASYGYGVRFDGVDPGGLGRLLLRAGATAEPAGRWTDYDLGAEWEARLEGRLAPLRDYAARVALADDAAILARTASAREALEGNGSTALDEPRNRFAASCLGEVDSARTLPGTFTHNAFASPELIAIGVIGGTPAREVLCAIGDDAGVAAEWADALRRSFGRDAREPQLGTPIGRSVRGADVTALTDEPEGLHAARAEITLAPDEPPGYLYGALVRGSVLPYVGAPPPIAEGTRLKLGSSPNSFR
jgi:hypothetical protein